MRLNLTPSLLPATVLIAALAAGVVFVSPNL
jgi:hypothetical protein